MKTKQGQLIKQLANELAQAVLENSDDIQLIAQAEMLKKSLINK